MLREECALPGAGMKCPFGRDDGVEQAVHWLPEGLWPVVETGLTAPALSLVLPSLSHCPLSLTYSAWECDPNK